MSEITVPPEPSNSQKPLVAICMPIGKESVHPLTVRSLIEMRAASAHAFDAIFLDTIEIGVENARNFITAKALENPNVTHLLFIDADMVFQADAAVRLLAHKFPIVGGLCHNRRHPFMPILIRKMPQGIEHAGAYAFMYDYDRGVVRVDATGGAFILVKREVFEGIATLLLDDGTGTGTLKEGWWTQRNGGEDISFCERAIEAGFIVRVDTTVEIGHVGEVVVDSDFARRNRSARVNAWRPW